VNAGITGLGTKLMPIAASEVRLCEYVDNGVKRPPSRLVGMDLLEPPTAQRFENETNAVRARPALPSCPPSITGYTFDSFVLTFANDSQRAVMVADLGCGGDASNGVFAAALTSKWLNELNEYIARCVLGPTSNQLPSCSKAA